MLANMHLKKMAAMPWGGGGSAWSHAHENALTAIKRSQTEIPTAYSNLLDHLGHRKEDAEQAN